MSPRDFDSRAADAMADEQLQANLKKLMILLKALHRQGTGSVTNFDELRQCASAVKKHTIENLDYYLEQFESRVIEKGGKVHYAQTCEDLNVIVIEICKRRGVKTIVKGKSMVSEETGLNKALEAAAIEVTETDMGEYIVQIAHERPSHLVGPAIHKNRKEIADLFLKHHDLGPRSLKEIPEIVAEGRRVLREKFLRADAGITGANVLIAETGGVVLVTNEGNADLCSTIPKMHIVVAGIEKLVPGLEDAGAVLRVLARSLTGRAMSCYTSFLTGPREGPQYCGPEELHVVLLDNHRTEIIGSEFRDILRCIRCSSCMNHCPVFGQTGGHAYGSVYSGPMGSVLTPIMEGIENAADLPDACSSDGRCAEVCPMMIPLPDLLRRLRGKERELGISKRYMRWGISAYMTLARFPRLYRTITDAGAGALSVLGHVNKSIPYCRGRTFFSLFARQRRRSKGAGHGYRSLKQ
jgi:L-lactate dehydrogenase complex protein LldF